jgi:phosphoglycerate kinase
VRGTQAGEVALLENLRFHIEEKGKVNQKDGSSVKTDPETIRAFRASRSKLGDVYVNDAFVSAHRVHSSITGISLEPRAAGYLMKRKLDFLGDAVEKPSGHPREVRRVPGAVGRSCGRPVGRYRARQTAAVA